MKPQFIALFLGILTLSSCYRQPDFDQLSSNFVVATNIDQEVNFSGFKTYYISDTIALVASDSKDTILFDNTAKQLVATVKQNMDARGFTFVSKGSHPDLGINMGVVKTVNTSTVIFPGWWYGYPGWWGGWYWGYGYPYYYPWSVTYVVTTGSILIDIVDLKDISDDHKLTVVWTAVMNGALGSSTSTNVQLGVNAINQSFIQSPGLSTK